MNEDETFDWYSETVKRLVPSLPKEWLWHSLGASRSSVHKGPPDTIYVAGCVTSRTFSKGPRKGERDYRSGVSHEMEMYVPDAEIAETKRRYVERTGNCVQCQGTRRVVRSVHHVDGTTYEPCGACSATGKAAA